MDKGYRITVDVMAGIDNGKYIVKTIMRDCASLNDCINAFDEYEKAADVLDLSIRLVGIISLD